MILSETIPGPIKPGCKTEKEKQTSNGEISEVEKPAPFGSGSIELPPFTVLMKWLHFYHSQTGAWPEPGELTTISPVAATANRSNPDTGPFTGNSPVTRPVPGGFAGSNSGNNTLMDKPLLKIVPGKTIKEKEVDRLKISVDRAASFDLKGSLYYQAASELIEKHATENKPLHETAVLALGSLLAWCSHPVFITAYKEKGIGPAMYLPLEQWSKTLKMRKVTLCDCIKELEKTGLIETHILTPEGTIKRAYRVAVPLHKSLPVFEPGEVKISREPGTTLFSEPEYEWARFEFPRTGPGPSNMTHEQKNNKISLETVKSLNTQAINTKIHEHDWLVKPGTVEEKMRFLTEVASFPGYASPEGLVTLDKREALKFALVPELDLNTIKKVYQQALSTWMSGKCIKNPIGFFHRSLSAHLRQEVAPSSVLQPFTTSNPAQGPLKEITGTRNSKKDGSRFPNKAPGRLDKFSKYAATVALEVTSGDPIEDVRNSEGIELNSRLSPIELLNQEQTVKDIRAQVLETLQDRFKQPELARLLEQLNWKMVAANGRLCVELESAGLMVVPTPVLGQSEISLLKIALSQRIRSLIGASILVEGSFEIDIVLVP